MSGGRHGYLSNKIQQVLDNSFFEFDEILNKHKQEKIKNIYAKIVEFTKAVEWYDSGDASDEGIFNKAQELQIALDSFLKKD